MLFECFKIRGFLCIGPEAHVRNPQRDRFKLTMLSDHGLYYRRKRALAAQISCGFIHTGRLESRMGVHRNHHRIAYKMTEDRERIQPDEAMESAGKPKTSVRNTAASTRSVSIVVLNHNDWAMTERCLNCLFEIEYPDYRITVIDNASQTPCPDGMPARFPKVEFLFNRHNMGYSEGCNRGIRHSRQWNPAYIWLLNNDTEVDTGSLKAMVRLFELNSRLGAVGSILCDSSLDESRRVWGGGSVSFLTGLPRHLRSPSNAKLDYICGASLLLRAAALDQVGLLDPDYFLYWEDTDICFRLRSAGWQLGVANDSIVVHRGSSTARFRSVLYDYHLTRSSTRFYQRHCSYWWLPALVSLSGRATKRALSGHVKNSIAVLAGFRDALGNACRNDFKP
jgi:GT2 family glycosyltransferase